MAVGLALLGVGACDDEGHSAGADPGAPAAATATVSAAGAKAGRFVQPPRPPFDPNPLRLPPASASVEEGATVYTVAKRALEGASPGSSLVLRHAEAVGVDRGLVMVRMGRGAPYAVHPGYVIAPRVGGRLRRGSYVLAPYRRHLRHAVVVSLKRDRVNVQYTDLGVRIGERRLMRDWVALQPAGLAPGNFAIARRGGALEHLLLVSSGKWGDGKTRWLALGYGAAATLVDESLLEPVALDFKPKVGEPVLVSWLGTMVPATVRDVDAPGLFKVDRRPLAPDLVVGADQLMAPPAAP